MIYGLGSIGSVSSSAPALKNQNVMKKVIKELDCFRASRFTC